jgi:hypothetical protein
MAFDITLQEKVRWTPGGKGGLYAYASGRVCIWLNARRLTTSRLNKEQMEKKGKEALRWN